MINNEEKQQISKSMKWYFHPVECVRMLRYYQLNMKFDNTIDYTPDYSNNPSLGVVIGTCGSLPYIDLQLHYLKNINGINKILVHDDCSNKKEELKMLCKQYNVDFYSSDQPMFYKEQVGSVGDTNAIYQGLIWAKQNNIEILVKLSRRLIPCYEWKTNLINLAKTSDAITFSSYCTQDPFNIRTECMGFYVPAWTKQYPLQCMLFTIQNELPIFAEFWFHELSKTLSGNNYSEKWLNYIKTNKLGYLHSGYALWTDIAGTCRFNNDNRHKNTLWHMYSKKEDYLNELNKIFPNKYKIQEL